MRGSCRSSKAAALTAVIALAQILFLSTPRADTAVEQELLARQALLITKALTYDSRLLARAGPQFTLAILFKPGVPASKRDADLWHARFEPLQSLRFLGLPFSVIRVPLGNPADTRTSLRDGGVDALMVCDGLDEELPAITKITHDLKIISIASNPNLIFKGLSLGVAIQEGKNSLIFNLPATRDEGAQFTSDILKLAKVIK